MTRLTPESSTANSRSVDLTNCDREPIHLPGSIQDHGAALVLDASFTTIQRHSANANALLGVDGQLNGLTADTLFGEQVAHALRNAAATSSDPARAAVMIRFELRPGAFFDVSLHRFKGNAFIEFQNAAKEIGPVELTRALMERMKARAGTDQFLPFAVRLLRGAFGYDRTMIYQFGHDGSGQVVAESKRSDLESFLGQYFPASDIPQQARRLYLRNTIRTISNSGATPVPIVPVLDGSGEPLDMSFAVLRSVSPIHNEYLRNMGVAASMSISIIVEGELWGLIACHHYTPRALSLAQRTAAEMIGDYLSLHLDASTQRRRLEALTQARAALDRFIHRTAQHDDAAEFLQSSLDELLAIVSCDGVGLWFEGRWTATGVVPPVNAIPALIRLSGAVCDSKPWATHALSMRLPDAESYRPEVSGILVIPLSQVRADYLVFFRREVVQTLNWAGDPEKSYESGPLGDRLTPRKSFAIWKQTVAGQSLPWSAFDREFAEAARVALGEIVLRNKELREEERRQSDARQELLVQELNHRVKNILAIIKSVIAHPTRDSLSLEAYVESLRGRIQALSFAHDQVAVGNGGALMDLLSTELRPYQSSGTVIEINGPPVWLDSRAFSVMALVFHEMITNCVKYGALSGKGARLTVDWVLDAQVGCSLAWRESDGPVVSPPKVSGFGTVLLDRSIPYDLGGKSEILFPPEGLRANFVIPAQFVLPQASQEESGLRTSQRSDPVELATLANVRVMVVEDQLLVAMDVENMLSALGVGEVVSCPTVVNALATLDVFSPDIAILDFNLGSGTSVPVAEALLKKQVPFFFATGYGDQSMIPSAYRAVPIVKKPYDADILVSTISALLFPGSLVPPAPPARMAPR